MSDHQEKPELHDAVCADCKKDCQVPFKPTSGKPVKCKDCFASSQGAGERRGSAGSGNRASRGGYGDRPKPRPTIDYTRQLESISAKMDKIIRLLETGSLERLAGTEAQRARNERMKEKVVDHHTLREMISEIDTNLTG